MSSSLVPSTPAADAQEVSALLKALVTFTEDKERDQFFSSRPEYCDAQIAIAICDEVSRRVRVDLHEAERLAAASQWLAEALDDDYCRGRSERAFANVAYLHGDYKMALSSYEAALVSFASVGDDKESAITRSSGLHSLVLLGMYERAFSWADDARGIFEDLGDELRLARLEGNLGNILFRQDRWGEAANCFRAAYDVLRRVGEPHDVAVSLRNMAVCHVSLNNFMHALDLYAKARVYCQEQKLEGLIGEIDYNIAYLHYLRGEYTLAIQLYNKTRVRCRELGERYHMALCDLDQAELFLELNLVGEAAELAQSAFASFDELEMGYETAKALANLAIARSREGKTFLALEMLERSREMFVVEENRVWPALIGLYQALVLYRAGRLLEAARLAESALEGFLEPLLPTKAAMCELLLARVHCEKDEYAQARDYCQRALERTGSLDVPALKHQLFFVLGEVEEVAGNPGLALTAYRKSQANLERVRSHLQTEELKIAFPEEKLAIYENLVDLILRQQSTVEEKRAVFIYIERAKSRSLADLMAFRAHALPPTSPIRSDQAGKVRKLREELNWYYRQIDLQEMRGDDRSLEEVAQLRDVSRRQEEHLLRTLKDLEATDQEFSSLQEAATVDLETIRSVLPGDTQLVEYYISRGTVYACLVDSEDLEIVPVCLAARVRELHRLLRFQLSKFYFGQEYVDEFSDLINEATHSHLEDLYAELVAPIRSALWARNLVLVPHSFLFYLPFHAFFDGEASLMESYFISYTPSASVYYFCCVKQPDSENKSLVMSVSEARREAGAIAEELADSELLVGAQATEDALRSSARRKRVVHIATKAVFRQDNPMFSSLCLGGSDLSLFDVYSLSLDAEVVSISGCGSGVHGGKNGDELVGLTRGLLYAGARSALMTSWDADSKSTRFFMRSFYMHLNKGGRRIEAVYAAMRQTRKEFPHPFYWAPYILFGSPEAIRAHEN